MCKKSSESGQHIFAGRLTLKILMYCRILFFIVFLVLPSIASARLGESAEVNQSRYGQAVKDNRNKTSPILRSAVNKTYHYQGWQIRIGYLNGHAVRIFYGKLPKPGKTQQLKTDEIQKILKAEAHNGQWKKLKPASLFSRKDNGNKLFANAQLRWINTNKCIAYSTNRMNLYVEAPEALIWEQAIANEVEILRKESVPQF